MSSVKIGVFGCGNMGRALVLGMRSRFPDAEFFLYTPTETKARELAQSVNGHFIQKLSDMPLTLDWYLLAFKPQSLEEFQFKFKPDSKIISVLAGVNTKKLIEKFNVEKMARLMPNTPSSIGEGANLYFLNTHFSKLEESSFVELLGATGHLFKMHTESDLDLTTAFSGSGPALVFELARIFEAELSRMTEGRVPAKDIVAQTFFGSSGLMKSEKSFEDLRLQVTSKKGVTYEALEVLKNKELQKTFSEAFTAAYKRTLELSK
jgi:pyrroline-5-carboxylate reductase